MNDYAKGFEDGKQAGLQQRETEIREMLQTWVDDFEGMDSFMEWLTGDECNWPEWVGPYR